MHSHLRSLTDPLAQGACHIWSYTQAQCPLPRNPFFMPTGRLSTRQPTPLHLWLVRLSVGNFLCGGTILSANIVVTAAHCVWTDGTMMSTSQITVHAGNHDSWENNEPGEQTRGVEAIFSYPGYPADSSNDIALFKLSSPLVLNELVSPACLPPQGRQEADYVGKTCYAAGWGTTSSEPPFTFQRRGACQRRTPRRYADLRGRSIASFPQRRFRALAHCDDTLSFYRCCTPRRFVGETKNQTPKSKNQNIKRSAWRIDVECAP